MCGPSTVNPSELKQDILRQEEDTGHRDLIARRAFNRILQGGRMKPTARKSSRGGVAVKTDPKLWAKAKEKACSEGKLCKHSARKMQYATNWYKSHGGGYKGPKSENNRLVRWGKQKWRTSDGKPSRGYTRYLPDKAWKMLTKEQKREANRTKREGKLKGKQFVSNPAAARRASKKARALD